MLILENDPFQDTRVLVTYNIDRCFKGSFSHCTLIR